MHGAGTSPQVLLDDQALNALPPSRLDRRRARAAIGALLVAAAVGGSAVAVAETPAVYRMENGVVGIDGDSLDAWYQGRVVSLDQIGDLNDDGKAMFSAHSIELACHGVAAYFDTSAQADAYGEGHTLRVKAIALERKALAPGADPADTDPCAWWRNPVPELPGLP